MNWQLITYKPGFGVQKNLTSSLNVGIIKIIIFIIPFLPLYISSSMHFPFITGKNFAFRILVELATVLWIGLIAAKKEYRIHNTPIVVSVLTFTFIVGLADLSGVNPSTSFWSNLERMEGYITILHLALYFMIVKSIFRARNDWKKFFNMVLLVSVLVSVFPLFFSWGDNTLVYRRFTVEYGTRVFSTIGNPPFLASYLLFSSFIGLILIFHTRKKYLGVVYFMAIILNCVVIYLTATRGAILSVAAGLLILISVYILGRSNQSKLMILKRTMLLLFVISIIITVGFIVFRNNELLQQDQTLSRFASMFSSDSVKSRIDVWGKAWNGIKERPILGWGQENFTGIYTVNTIPLKGEQIWMDRAHNVVIEWLINAGILGLSSYLAIFGSAFYILRKAAWKKIISKYEAVMILTTLLVYFIQNLFTFDTINTYMIFFALLAYIDNLALDQKQIYTGLENNTDLKKIKVISVSAAMAALLCIAIVFYYINYKPIKQSRQMIRTSFASPENDSYSVLLREFNDALSINTLGDFDVRRSMLAVSNQILRMQLFDQEGALKFIQATVEELRKEIEIRSYDLEYMTNVINFFNQIAVYDKSIIVLSEALIKKCMRINPEYQWLYMAMADVKILKKDYEGAFKSVKSIAEPYPDDEKKQFKLALMAIYSSREEAAKQALDNVKKIRIAKDKNIVSEKKPFLALVELHQLAKSYRETERYILALQYLKKIITIVSQEKMYFEQDARYYMPEKKAWMRARIHVELAEIYLKLDDSGNALKEAEKAVEIDPGLSENISHFIDSINN